MHPTILVHSLGLKERPIWSLPLPFFNIEGDKCDCVCQSILKVPSHMLFASPTFQVGKLLPKEERAGPILHRVKLGSGLWVFLMSFQSPERPHHCSGLQPPPCLRDSLPPSQLLWGAGVPGDRIGPPPATVLRWEQIRKHSKDDPSSSWATVLGFKFAFLTFKPLWHFGTFW